MTHAAWELRESAGAKKNLGQATTAWRNTREWPEPSAIEFKDTSMPNCRELKKEPPAHPQTEIPRRTAFHQAPTRGKRTPVPRRRRWRPLPGGRSLLLRCEAT